MDDWFCEVELSDLTRTPACAAWSDRNWKLILRWLTGEPENGYCLLWSSLWKKKQCISSLLLIDELKLIVCELLSGSLWKTAQTFSDCSSVIVLSCSLSVTCTGRLLYPSDFPRDAAALFLIYSSVLLLNRAAHHGVWVRICSHANHYYKLIDRDS